MLMNDDLDEFIEKLCLYICYFECVKILDFANGVY